MRWPGRSKLITLGDVEQAFEEDRRGETRRGSEGRREDDGASKERSSVLLWALAIVGAAAVALGAAQFTDLKTEFRAHKVLEEAKHEELRTAVGAIDTEIKLRTQREGWRDAVLKAVAKKLHVEINEVEEGGKP